jgi:hypothetical protein
MRIIEAKPEPLRFDYAALDAEKRQMMEERAARVHQLARKTAAAIVEIGKCLSEVKARLKHGEFLDWIEREFGWDARTARNFMTVHERFKTANFANLEIDVSALYLIARPSTPEPVRAEVMRRAQNGESVSKASARALNRTFQETGAIAAPEQNLPAIVERRPVARELEAAAPADRFRGLDEAVKYIGDFPVPASDAWNGLYQACVFDFDKHLTRALDYLSRMRRAYPTKDAK